MPKPARTARPFRSRRPVSLACLTLAVACVAHAQDTQLNVPTQPLDQAVASAARQLGVQVLMPAELAANRRSPALNGRYAARDALQRLLAGSGLVLRELGPGAYTVEREPAPAPAASTGQVATLTEVSVVASAEPANPAITEGTESYTTPQMSTATKLQLSPRETPQSVTVITRQRMDDQNLGSIVDVVQATPGLYVSGYDGAGRPAFMARGYYASVMYEGFSSDFSSYMPSSQANADLFDRVEVVRGATGLAQGRGNPSAAINMIFKRPTSEFKGEVRAGLGQWQDYGAMADVGGPINKAGTLRARLVASGQDTHTFRDVERLRHGLLYGVAEADLSASTLLTVGAFRQTDFTNHWWYDLPMAASGAQLDLPRSTFAGNDWEYADNRVTTAFATLDQKLAGDWKLRLASLLSWRSLDLLGTAMYREADWGSTYYQSIWGGLTRYRDANYDLSLTGPVRAWGREHQLVVGATRQSSTQTTRNRAWNPFRISGIDIFSWNPYAHAKPVGTFTSISKSATTQDSAYAAAHLALSDPLKLLVGLRYDWYDYDNRTGSGSYSVPHNLTRYLGATYDLDDRHTVYASFTDIFKPQSSKGLDGNVIDPVVGENYEVGIKGAYFGGALNVSAAYFWINQKNRARLMDNQNGCPQDYCYEAAGLIRTKGVDVEVQGAITPRWQLGGGFTYAEDRYVTDASADNIGKRVSTYRPLATLKLSTLYRFGGDWHRWRVGGALNWQSGMYASGTTGGRRWRSEQGAYAVADVVVGYQSSKSVDVQLNISNLFDKTYRRAIGTSATWGSTNIYGEPRKVKLTARYRF